MENLSFGNRGLRTGLGRLGRLVARVPGWLLIGAVYIYRWALSPLVGRQCRFQPTCSVYFIESVRKYGAVRGAFRGAMRICRCHPWNPGGYDPP
jgi:hypothetical protein